MEKKNSKTYWLVFIGVALLIAIIIFCVWLPYKNKTKAPASNQNVNTNENINSNTESGSFDQKDNQNLNNNSNTNLNDNLNQNDNINSDTNSADYYYNLGLQYTNEKSYSLAIDNFNKAIAINPHSPDYYSKKAEAQIGLDDKAGAIATVEAGLVANPNNPMLTSKLEILQTVIK